MAKKVIVTYDQHDTKMEQQLTHLGGIRRKMVGFIGESLQVSDGYHTMDELYDHRIALFIALCKRLNDAGADVWRSELHADGKGYTGWFILGIGKEKGKQISYHLPMARWGDTDFAATLETAPEWDGHTPADVINRLKTL
jgi:hypothetical protein